MVLFTTPSTTEGPGHTSRDRPGSTWGQTCDFHLQKDQTLLDQGLSVYSHVRPQTVTEHLSVDPGGIRRFIRARGTLNVSC